ncbi:MAG TPA: hypothetical protein VIV15_03825 [Anaerolineales bacterium]
MRNYKPTGRKRGAPAHNQNNLKHGIYSEYITSADQAGIEVMPADKNADELALARVRIRTCIRKQAEVPPALWVELERVIACYLRIIIALTHKNAVLRLEKSEDTDYLKMFLTAREEYFQALQGEIDSLPPSSALGQDKFPETE